MERHWPALWLKRSQFTHTLSFLNSWVTLDKLHKFSEPKFLHVKMVTIILSLKGHFKERHLQSAKHSAVFNKK